MRNKVQFTLFFYIIYLSLFAAPQSNVAFKYLTTNEGLSQSRINCIFQDSRGFIWIGTDDGLNLFNGYENSIFNNSAQNSISGNYVFDIIEDENKNLLIATNEGVDKFDPVEEEFIPLIFLDPDTINRIYIKKLRIDNNNKVWAISHAKAFILNKHAQFVPFVFKDNNEININRTSDILFDKENNLWLTSETEGLLVFDNKSQKLINFNLQNSKFSNELFSIFQDSQENILIGSSEGVYFIQNPSDFFRNGKLNIMNYLELKTVNDIIEDVDDKGNFWFCTSNGLVYYDYKNNKFNTYKHNKYTLSSLNNDVLHVIYRDIQENLWIGTRDRGVNIIERQHKKFNIDISSDFNTIYSNQSVTSIFKDSRSYVWIGTNGNGVFVWDSISNEFKQFIHQEGVSGTISANDVLDIAEDVDGNIWIGTYSKGITVFNRDFKAINYYTFNYPEAQSNNQVFCIFKDSFGNMWIGTNGVGLYQFNKSTNKFKLYNVSETHLSSNYIVNLMEDRKGNLWIATYWGLNMMDLNTKRITTFYQSDQPGSISSNVIYSLHQDQNNNIWIGTAKGLNLFDPEKNTFKFFTKKDGLPNNIINGILSDKKNNLWISTNNGISKFDLIDSVFLNYDKKDGLVSNNFIIRSYYKSEDGVLFFGSNEGFNAFDPEEIKTNNFIPPVYISDIKLFNSSIKKSPKSNKYSAQSNELNLAYNENFITIEYVALNYINSAKNKYKYFLEGFDYEWHDVNNARAATYTNLDPGEYAFKVIACNNDGVWNYEGASLKIIIDPPFWLTWWAYIFYFVLIILLLYLFRRFIRNREKLKHNLQIERLEHQKSDELYQSKLRFFTNISHEFRTPLTLILAPLENLVNSGTKMKRETIISLIKLAYRNSGRLLHLVNQLLDIRRIELGKMNISVEEFNLISEINDISSAFKNLAERRNIEFEIISGIQDLKVWLDKEKLRQIMYNLISNAFKYSHSDGKVSIKIYSNQNEEKINENLKKFVLIEVEDNGLGIKEKDIPFIFNRFYHAGESKSFKEKSTGIGLSLSKELVEIQSGEIKVISEPGKGSIFSVMFSLGKNHYKPEDFKQEMNDKVVDFEIPVFEEFEKIVEEDKSSKSEKKAMPVILIIEDNIDLLTYLNSILKKYYKIYEAEDGKKGFDLAIKYNPDIIVSDVMMPEMDGITLLKQLKNDIRTSHIPVILLSAKNQLENQIEGLETGAEDYISKPFNNEILLLKVRNIISSRKQQLEVLKKNQAIDIEQNSFSIVDRKFLKRTMDTINRNIENIDFSVEHLAKEVGISRSQLFRKLKILINQNPNELIRGIRLKMAADLLKGDEILEIHEIMDKVGFQNINYFRKCFINQYGVKPELYGNKSKE